MNMNMNFVNYVLLLDTPNIKTLYDILQNPQITKVHEKKDHIVTYSIILEMGFNTIKIDFSLEKNKLWYKSMPINIKLHKIETFWEEMYET